MGKVLTPLDALKLGPIVPCGLNKRPLIKWKKYQKESPTEEQVLEWQEKFNPPCWALITGERAKRVVLDFDGEKGERTREHMGLPAPHRRTPRGGHHVDVVWPGYRVKTLTCENDTALMERCPGMDIRGDGGFAVVLGRSDVGVYEWLLDTTEPYVLSPETWAMIQPSKPEKKAQVPKDGADKPNGSAERVDVDLLVRMALSQVARGRGRNNAGAWLAEQLRDNDYAEVEALAVAFPDRCPPTDAHGDESPYTPEEWFSTVESIYSQPKREPWSEPEETPPPPVVLAPSDSAEIPFTDSAQAAAPPPAPEKVDVGALLDKICTLTRRFVRMSDAQHEVNALWVVHTHALEAADFTPYIHIRSAVRRSGKTRLLEVNELIVYEPLLTGGITKSALVRSVDKFHPTILMDEIDAIFNAHGDLAEALRGIINTGYARSGKYIMNVPVGNGWEPRKFSTFGPKMFAGIGKCLPSTVRDRSLLFDIKRRHQKKEPIERFRSRDEKPKADELRQQLAQWGRDNGVALGKARPALPEELDDRRWDVIEPLLAIADMAGGTWPEQAREALKELCGVESADSAEIGIRLLTDIKSVFGTVDQLQTEVLLGSLMALSESPWREYGRNGAPITAKQLAELLEDFGPRPRKIHEGVGADRRTLRGYLRSDFQDAWERYPLPEEEEDKPGPVPAPPAHSDIHPPHVPQPAVYAGPSGFSYPPHEAPGADRKSEESPINTRGGAGGAGEIPNGRAGEDPPPDSAEVEPWPAPGDWARVPEEIRFPAPSLDWKPTDSDELDDEDEEDTN